MKRAAIIILVVIVVLALAGAAYYFFIRKSDETDKGTGDGDTGNGDGTDTGTGIGGRMSAVEVQSIIDNYSVKDSIGTPTLHYSGGFDSPDVFQYPVTDLQKMLLNNWWFALVVDSGTNNLNGYRRGKNNQYVLSFMDLKAPRTSPINSGKSQVTIPVQFAPYLT